MPGPTREEAEGSQGTALILDLDDSLWERVRAAPANVGLDVSRETFAAFLAAKASSREAEVQAVHVPDAIVFDLYLACACALGSTTAIQRFEERYTALIESARVRLGRRAPSADDLRADLHARLFVARPDGKPRIHDYSGVASLASWLKVVVTRLLLNRIDAERPEDAYEDRILEGLAVTEESPESLLAHEEASAQFRLSFRRSVKGLAARDRELLRRAFAQGFTIDDLAALYGVHRTTALRWLQRATEALAVRLEKDLRLALDLRGSDYESWYRWLRSGLHLSLERHLRSSSSGGG